MIEGGVSAAVIEETVPDAGAVVTPDDLPFIIDTRGPGVDPEGIVKRGVSAVAVKEAVQAVAVIEVIADDVAGAADANCIGAVDAQRIVERTVSAFVVEKAVDAAAGRVSIPPHDLA